MSKSLPYPPPWQDKETLAAHLCVSVWTIENWVQKGIIPAGRLRGGKLFWKWREVDEALTFGNAVNTDSLAERVYNGTKAALNEIG